MKKPLKMRKKIYTAMLVVVFSVANPLYLPGCYI